ncbi:MAG TPA: cation:proton antiporter, partial [Acidimicrobiales bacterium]|nr:cation:proton antiporter [Acidimicrobiales bacterium]
MTVERGAGSRPATAQPDAVAQPTARHRRSGILLYGGMAAAGLVVLQVVLRAGRRLPAPKPAGGATGPKLAVDTGAVVWKLLLAAVLVIVVARLAGAAFQRINQPQVVGEIVAGIILGPSVLGAIVPQFSRFVFTTQMLPFLDVLAQVGLIFFMFLVGLELDVRLIRGRGHTAATVSGVSIIAPFLLGVLAALVLFPTLGSVSGRFTPFALFLGASMSITAFPVLARILTERNLYKTPLGAVTLTCAAVDDVTAWCMLAVVVAIARAHGSGRALLTVGLSGAFVVVMIYAVRPQLARMARYHEERGQLPTGMLALLFVAILLSALATDRIGIHAIFGAFLLGAIMPARSELVGELVAKLEDFTVVFLLPLFFAFTGLRTNVGLLGADLRLWGLCGLVLLVAVAGKWGGSAVAARVMGMGWRESMALGVLMNTRGLTELIILNIGLDLKVIPPALFTMLVLMALVTTFMTTPLLSLAYGHDELERMVREETDEDEEEGPRPWRIIVPVATPSEAHELVHTALRLARDREEAAEVVLLRVVHLPGSSYRAGYLSVENLVERATEKLRPLVQLVEGAGAT